MTQTKAQAGSHPGTRAKPRAKPRARTLLTAAAVVAFGLTGVLWWQTHNDAQEQPPDTYQVAGRPHDGDTFRVTLAHLTRTAGVEEEGSQPVRILGIDTPEVSPTKNPPDCYGPEAQQKTRDLLTNRQVTLEPDPRQGDTDRYGRWLRYVQTPDVPDVGAYLVEHGYARTLPQYPTGRTPEYQRLQDEAKQASRGGWAVCAW